MKPSLHTVALDLATKVFHLVGADTTGNMLWRRRLTRPALIPFIAQLPPVLIGRDACGGAHDWQDVPVGMATRSSSWRPSSSSHVSSRTSTIGMMPRPSPKP
jgi:hypothetical protein